MEIIELFGSQLPKYQDCQKCGKVNSCNFISGIGYYQPCSDCRKEKAYREELDKADKEGKKRKKINESLENQVPVAVHEYKGEYLYTNRRGDIMKTEKATPMKRGEKWKRT